MRELFPQFETGVEALWPLEEGSSPATGRRALATVVLVGTAFGLLCAAGRLVTQNTQGIAVFWPANGILIAYLLRQPVARWWKFLLASGLGDLGSALVLGAGPFSSGSTRLSLSVAFVCAIVISLCNIAEVLIAAMFLRRALGADRDLGAPRFMFRFLFFAVLLTPVTVGVLAALLAEPDHNAGFMHALLGWIPPHAVGIAMMTPFTLAVCDPQLKKIFAPQYAMRNIGALLAVLVGAFVVFGQTEYALRFAFVPLLLVVAFQMRLLGSIIAIFEIVIVGSLYTLHHSGPFWLAPHSTLESGVALLQAGTLTGIIWMVPFAATLDRQRKLRKGLRLGMERYQLLADNSRDIVVLASLQGQRLYVSPAVEDVLGWKQEEWLHHDAMELMHPDDAAPFQRILKEMVHGVDRRTFRYRTRHRNGQYIWMEASLRVLPNERTGEPEAFVANVRDISERMEAASKLEEAHRLLQQQAQRDGLTQLANRRHFDEALEREWRRGRRTKNPLALLMIDIDHFKRINDTYGHRAGDQCLKIVASLLKEVGRRPSDVIARYGGEEFALLLPDVTLEAAAIMADILCMKVRQKTFEAGVGRSLSLTVSIGLVAQVPDKNSRADQLVEAADRALYTAKQLGRNRVAHDNESISPAELLAQVR